MMDDYADPLTPRKQRILDAVMENAPAVIRRFYRPACCIAATRVMVEVFTRLRCLARPLSVTVEVRNGAFVDIVERTGRTDPGSGQECLDWFERGAWSVILGHPAMQDLPRQWHGHLVCVVWEEVICDLSLPQACRPDKGIHLIPLACAVRPEFLDGREAVIADMEGCEVYYLARPEDRSYAAGVDWYDKERHNRAIEAILFRAKRALA